MVRAVINGFGRIGRSGFRVWLAREDLRKDLDIVAINTSGSMDVEGWAHILKYDSNYGMLSNKLEVEEVRKAKEATEKESLIGYLKVDDFWKIPVLAQRDPEKIPWKDFGVDVVIEATGVFRDEKGAGLHIKAGARKVLISAPSKGEGIGTHVLGVNEYDGKSPIADNASCTTNCTAPVMAILHEALKVKKAGLTTIHGYTDDQNLQDGSHKDLRRARAAAMNSVPTSTGAAIATTKTIPDLKGKFDGIAVRVPVPVGSISDITCLVGKKTSVEEVNKLFEAAAGSARWKGILAVTRDPLVSSDIVGRNESSIVDLELTQVIDGDLVKVFAWYDNEWGYCNRLLEQTIAVGSK